MKPGELKVYYHSSTINTELDEAIVKCLEKFKYKRWASGMDVYDQIRDIAFELNTDD